MSKTTEQQANSLSVVHPMNTYPSAIGIIIFMYAVVEFSATAIVVGSIFTILGIGSFITNRYIRTEYFVEQAMKAEHDSRTDAVTNRIKVIGSGLRKFEQVGANDQLDLLTKKVETFNDILINRFDGQGLAYSRFLGISDSIFSNGLNSYEEMILLLKQANSIDSERCRTRISEIRNAPEHESELRTLQTRLKLKTDIASRIKEMLLFNEEAMTKLDVTMSSFADLSTDKELEWAMKELQNLSTALLPNQNGEFS